LPLHNHKKSITIPTISGAEPGERPDHATAFPFASGPSRVAIDGLPHLLARRSTRSRAIRQGGRPCQNAAAACGAEPADRSDNAAQPRRDSRDPRRAGRAAAERRQSLSDNRPGDRPGQQSVRQDIAHLRGLPASPAEGPAGQRSSHRAGVNAGCVDDGGDAARTGDSPGERENIGRDDCASHVEDCEDQTGCDTGAARREFVHIVGCRISNCGDAGRRTRDCAGDGTGRGAGAGQFDDFSWRKIERPDCVNIGDREHLHFQGHIDRAARRRNARVVRRGFENVGSDNRRTRPTGRRTADVSGKDARGRHADAVKDASGGNINDLSLERADADDQSGRIRAARCQDDAAGGAGRNGAGSRRRLDVGGRREATADLDAVRHDVERRRHNAGSNADSDDAADREHRAVWRGEIIRPTSGSRGRAVHSDDSATGPELGEQFGHSKGIGVGLDAHEQHDDAGTATATGNARASNDDDASHDDASCDARDAACVAAEHVPVESAREVEC